MTPSVKQQQQQQQHSSSSDSDSQHGVLLLDDQRKRKRMLSNRESARRSRMRKQQHLDGLTSEAARLMSENAQLALRVTLTTQQRAGLESANAILRAQLAELTDRLQSANSVLLRLIMVTEDEFGGGGMAVVEMDVPDPLLKPWQLPCPSQAILADAFLY